jgi:membrane-associated phospholipid phosphatase
LRDGSLRLIDLAHAEGLVSFPSFHACLAVVCAAAARGLGPARFVFYLLNLLIVIASPMIGGHYFVDIFAGLLLGGLASLTRAERAG